MATEKTTSPVWIRLLDADLKYLRKIAKTKRVSVAQAGRDGLTEYINKTRDAESRAKTKKAGASV